MSVINGYAMKLTFSNESCSAAASSITPCPENERRSGMGYPGRKESALEFTRGLGYTRTMGVSIFERRLYERQQVRQRSGSDTCHDVTRLHTRNGVRFKPLAF